MLRFICLYGVRIDRSESTDWNGMFQTALELSESNRDEAVMKYTRLTHLATHFVSVATQYGRVIITEMSLPLQLKTIKPLTKVPSPMWRTACCVSKSNLTCYRTPCVGYV